MRKIFTIAAAMLLGASAFTANAQSSTVDFYFQDDWEVFEIEDPYKYVTIWNDTDSESVEITGNYMPFSYTTTTILRISPEDLDYEIRVSVNDADTDSYDLDKDETQYYLTLYPGYEGLEVTVKVYPEGLAPADDDVEYEELTATFYITSTGANKVDDPYKYVKISYGSGNEVEIEDDEPSATLPKGAVVTVSAEEGYLITNVSTFSNAGACSGPDTDGSWNINISNTLTVEEASFFISVESDPTTADAQTSTVGFYFVCDEDVFEIDNPYTYVTIWNDTDSESVEITSNYMPFSYTTTTILRISPEDYDYEIRVSVKDDADTGSYDLDKEENQYYLTLYPGSEGLEVFVTVYPEGSAPADGVEYDELTATFYITSTGENKVDDPYQYVKISYNSDNEVEIEDDEPSATLPKGAVVSVSAEEGYLITNVSTFSNAGECSGPNSDGSWNIYINNTLTVEEASFFISVESDPTTGINALNAIEEGAEIYSIQGLKVNKANITNGLYIINGQKVYINK